MIHPSYTELMEAVNSGNEQDGQPVVESRYSIVIAAAKRAKQLIEGAEPTIENAEGKKPLSIAVEELYNRNVNILAGDDEDEEEEEIMTDLGHETYGFSSDEGDGSYYEDEYEEDGGEETDEEAEADDTEEEDGEYRDYGDYREDDSEYEE